MYIKETILKNESGLHARPAATFVALANTFESKITIQRVDESQPNKTNAKSILMVLAQGILKDTRIRICAEGFDEKEAVDQLIKLVETKLVD